MEAAGSAATILQLISFTGEVLVAGYGYLSKVQKAPAEIRSLLNETASINALLDQLQTLVTEDATPHTLNALETLIFHGIFGDCKSLMKAILRSIKACEQTSGQEARNFGKRMLWPFKEKETKNTLQQLGRLREALSAAVAVDSAKALTNLEAVAKMIDSNVISVLDTTMQVQNTTFQIAEDVSQLKIAFSDKVSTEEKAAVYSWLLPDGIDTDTSFEVALSLRHPSTGRWFLSSNTFQDWSKRESGYFWVYGIPGCGKTILSATVVEYLRTDLDQKQSIVLYFFCNHRNPSKRNLKNCLNAFSKQLLDMSPEYFNYIKEQFHEKLQKTQGQQGTPAKLSTDEYISLIKQFCLQFEKVFIVLDALDECVDRSGFFRGLLRLSEDSPTINLFLTSRYEVELERVINPVASHRLALKEHMRSDIRMYLYAQTTTRVRQGSLKLRQENLVANIIAALEAKADGMILIAKLQLDYLCGLKSDRSIKEALDKLPTSINATYDEILQQLCTQNPENIDEIRLILEWLVGSSVPLTLDQLAEAVSIRPGDRRLERDGIATDAMDLAASCGSLVTIYTQETHADYHDDLRGTGTTLISLSHASVEEYLTSTNMKLGPLKPFFMDLQAVHREITETCLQYIGFEDFKRPIKLPTFSNSNTLNANKWYLNREILKERTSQYVLYDYVCAYWATHLRLSGSHVDTRTVELLRWFLAPERYPGWYESWQQMYHHNIQHYCQGRPPLHYAIEFKIPSIVELLLPKGHEVDTLHHGMAALHEAARWGDISTCTTLLDRGASVKLKSSPETRSMTALHFAAEGGHSAMIQMLLARGADPHVRSRSQATPFYRAARSGSLDALRILYAAGSDINARTWDNWTPLFEAVAGGQVHIANQLLEWGADPTITNLRGQNVLTFILAAMDNDHSFSESHDDARVDLDTEPKSPSGTEDRKEREAMILLEIQKLQAETSAKSTGETFNKYLVNIVPGYFRPHSIEFDTRPGIERDKSLLWVEDDGMDYSSGKYLIAYPPTGSPIPGAPLPSSDHIIGPSRGLKPVNTVNQLENQ